MGRFSWSPRVKLNGLGGVSVNPAANPFLKGKVKPHFKKQLFLRAHQTQETRDSESKLKEIPFPPSLQGHCPDQNNFSTLAKRSIDHYTQG